MIDEKNGLAGVPKEVVAPPENAQKGSSRRKFLGQVGVAAGLAAGTLAAPITSTAQSENSQATTPAAPAGVTNPRILQAFTIRVTEATTDALLGPAKNVNNGDQALYADHGGTYTKGLLHDQFGRVT